VTKKERQTV